jgi:KipI family sensor histidine kinase inhibitor
MWDKLSIEAVCESSILIRFSDQIDTGLPVFIQAIAEIIVSEHTDAVMNITPSYTTLLVDYLPYRISEEEMINSIASILHYAEVQQGDYEGRTIELPVYYHPSVAPDLEGMLEAKNLTLEQFIGLHSGEAYTVCAIGFTPGFAFLAELPEVLAEPRLDTPRLTVRKGSVGIADRQTAIYPSQSPGGWNIVGNCPIELFDPASEHLSPFRIGDKVRFKAIEREQYLRLGGTLWE